MNDETPPLTPPAPDTGRSRGLSLARVWPVFIVAGIAYLIAAGAKFILHQPEGGLFVGCGVAFLVIAWIAKPKSS